MEQEKFLQRWARLKSDGRPQSLPTGDRLAKNVGSHDDAVQDGPAAATPVQKTSPTLDDAALLTPDSDYSAYVAHGVDKAVRRTALKKLFSDPHFNLLDGLDIYMGDYNQASPVSASMLAALQQAQGFLQRVSETVEDDAAAKKNADDGKPAADRARQPLPGDES